MRPVRHEHAFGRARTEAGRARWLYTGCATAVIAVLFLRLETVKELAIAATQGAAPPHPLVQAVMIPSALWMVVIGMMCLAAAERCRVKARQTMLATDDGTDREAWRQPVLAPREQEVEVMTCA